MESQVFEAIVIGAGIMGSSTAYFLSKSLGAEVLLLEQFDTLHKRGSSHGESRIIRMTYPEEFNTSLMSDAYKFWNQIQVEAKTKLLTKTGGLCIGKKDNSDMELILKNLDTFKIPYTILTPEATIKKFPTVKLNKDCVAIYNEDAGVLNASKSVSTIQQLAKQNGCIFYDNMPVSKIQAEKQENGKEFISVHTQNGKTFFGKKCIITSGAWTKKILEQFNGMSLPLQPVQTAIAYWKVDSPAVYSAANFPIFMSYDDKNPIVYGIPALEYPNMIKCASDGGSHCDPDERNFQTDWDCITGHASGFIKTCFTGVSDTPSFTESCMYTMSSDRQFIIDVLPSNSNIFIGCGFSGHGFKLGPVVGKILADLTITGVHPYPHVHPHFTVLRF